MRACVRACVRVVVPQPYRLLRRFFANVIIRRRLPLTSSSSSSSCVCDVCDLSSDLSSDLCDDDDSSIRACASWYVNAARLRITPLVNRVDNISPLGRTCHSTLNTSRSSFPFKLHISSVNALGNISIRRWTRYVVVDRLAASASTNEPGFTKYDTSAI